MAKIYKKVLYDEKPIQVQSAIEDGIGRDIQSTYLTRQDIVSTTSAGLAPTLSGSTSQFLRGDGTWATISGVGGQPIIRATVTVDSVTDTISIPTELADAEGMGVYYNGLLMTANLNYTINKTAKTIKLLDFNTRIGDVLTFVSTMEVGSQVNPMVRATVTTSTTGTTVDIPSLIADYNMMGVYYNGLLLTPGTHYTVDATAKTITLIGFSYEADDIFTFTANLDGASQGGAEVTNNKVTTLSASSTHDQYPSAKTVYDAIQAKTYNVVSTTASGLAPQLSNDANQYLNGQGQWATVTMPSTMNGATASTAGMPGLVPLPAAGKQASFLRGDGTWAVPTDTNTTYSAGTGISLSGTTFSNSGVRSITQDSSDGHKLTINTNGTNSTITIPDTNTWRGIQNVLTSDSTTDSLSAAQGKALANGSARDNTKFPAAGGTLTGAASVGITFKTTSCANAYLNVYDVGNTYNQDVVLHSSGSVIIGAGESGGALRSGNIDSINGSENLAISADGIVYVYTYCDTIGNRKKFTFGTDGAFTATSVVGAVWNDYAEYRQADTTEPGRCIVENGDDTLSLAIKRMQPGAAIISDTFGFAIGETDESKTPIAVSGRVLAYPCEDREEFKKNIGRPVCSGPNGTVSIMTDEEYQKYGYCAIGIISAVPEYEIWGTGNVPVDGRVWIKVN